MWTSQKFLNSRIFANNSKKEFEQNVVATNFKFMIDRVLNTVPTTSRHLIDHETFDFNTDTSNFFCFLVGQAQPVFVNFRSFQTTFTGLGCG